MEGINVKDATFLIKEMDEIREVLARIDQRKECQE